MQGERAARRGNVGCEYWGPRPGAGWSKPVKAGNGKKTKRLIHKMERQAWRRTQDDRTHEAF